MLPKRIALSVFASDPLSSVAYATQEILLVLTLGGLACLYMAPWVAAAVVVLLAVVVLSYRQVVQAYPLAAPTRWLHAIRVRGPGWWWLGSDGGLRDDGGLVGGGRRGQHHLRGARARRVRVLVNLAFVALLTAMNLRGVRESGRLFAVPTYLFIAGVVATVVAGLLQTAFGHAPVAESATWQVHAEPGGAGLTGMALVLLACGRSPPGVPR